MFQPAEAWQPQFDPPLPPFRTYNLESWFEDFAAALELNGIWLQAFMFEVHLRSGIFVKEEQWASLLSRPKDSLFCKEATKLLCSILELQNKNPTVAPCRRLVRQEDKRATEEGPDTKKFGGCGYRVISKDSSRHPESQDTKTRWANAFSPFYGPFSVHATRDAESSGAGRVPQGADGVNPMESAASAGDAQDTDADVRTMDVQQECDESPATTDNEEGWHTVHHGRRRKPGHGSAGDADGSHGANNKGEPSLGKTQANTQERRINRIEKASRMPKLPAGDYKVVIRPRGGLCVAALGPMDITRGIHEAAATPPEVRQFDVICPNKTQNIMVVSTPDPDRADQYRRIKKYLYAANNMKWQRMKQHQKIQPRESLEESHSRKP
ncbi:hypothetical protein HPB52_010614 [Rhipicephalus sanguineus]|uniref:Uncharacterized protein n=1 Tax=Rhipicephalus sanguineus TaxID=34632 RepID=A0A9D4T1R3_RHISA|nr:hypothetical protein HPB52_010614 [Rhipicephalus sanguineus]